MVLGKQDSKRKSPEEEWPRWRSKETLSSPPPPMGTPKVQVFTEQLLMKGPEDLAEKTFYT